jgi:hypothetical protein
MGNKNKKSVVIKIKKKKGPRGVYSLSWTDEEKTKLESRILNLRKDQIAALLNLVGLDFSKDDIKEVVKDIIENKQNSGHLSILTDEADSKENLLWWIDYFESANENKNT